MPTSIKLRSFGQQHNKGRTQQLARLLAFSVCLVLLFRPIMCRLIRVMSFLLLLSLLPNRVNQCATTNITNVAPGATHGTRHGHEESDRQHVHSVLVECRIYEDGAYVVKCDHGLCANVAGPKYLAKRSMQPKQSPKEWRLCSWPPCACPLKIRREPGVNRCCYFHGCRLWLLI